MNPAKESPPFVIEHRDEFGSRTFFTNPEGRGLFKETKDGNRQIVGTCNAGPFATESEFRAYVEKMFA